MGEVKKQIKNSRCLVAGGSGFIGARIVNSVLDGGAKEVIILGRTIGSIKNSRVRYVICDLTQEQSVAIIKNLGVFDYVFNLIGLTDQRMPHPNPMELFNANVLTLIHLTQGIAWDSVVGAVHAGSNAEYGTQPLPHQEDMALRPTNIYGWSKADASLYAQTMTTSGFAKWSVARPFFVYGPGRHTGFVCDLIETLMQGNTFAIAGNSTRDPIFIDDVAIGFLRLAVCPLAAGQIVNICSGKEVFMARIAEMVKQKIAKGKVTFTSKSRPGDMLRSRGSIKKLKALTGWSPGMSLSQGLDIMIKEYNRPHSKLRGIPHGIRGLKSADNGGVISSIPPSAGLRAGIHPHRRAAGMNARDNKKI